MVLEGLSFDRLQPFTGLDMIILEDFDTLRAEREMIDAAIQEWAETGLTDDILSDDLHYTSIVNPREVDLPMALCVSHFFNHQTHHRGQATTLLSEQGLDPGVTDMIAMP